jgi:hypothetical protein
VPHGILQVSIIILYENVFQNPELFPTQVSLYPEKSTLVVVVVVAGFAKPIYCGHIADIGKIILKMIEDQCPVHLL